MWLFKRVITVHGLGGCPMGANDQDGVVDVDGEVFHYPGLYVVDGAAMPGPVGPNPSFTIAAFADHVADGILSAGGGAMTPVRRAARLKPKYHLDFTEEMKGFFTFDEADTSGASSEGAPRARR